LWVGEALVSAAAGRLLETNIDDMNPEFSGVMERIFEADYLDVYMTPSI
jgi:uncharacterized protein (DUF111 family)